MNGLDVEIETPDKPTQADEIERQLDAKKQVVFYGPPGTGKTYIAKEFADWWVHENTEGTPRDDQVQAVTFHPSFSYEDFLEGLSADATESGAVEYEIDDGVLKRIADTAADAYRNADSPASAPPYVLIIDEINRGNLSQIFGETITLLESDKRESFTTQLAHSDESFSLPPNLYLIGTMNTADRSIALVDAALRRRFRFLPFPPDTDVLADHHGLDPTALPDEAREADDRFESLLALSIRAIETINDNITDAPDLSKGQQIGHSYLFGVETVDGIVDAWRFDILPLIEEYYFGQFDRIRRHLFDGAGDAVVNWDDERIRQFGDAALASFLMELTELDTDYESKSVDSVASPGDSRSPSPTYPEFLGALNEELYEEVGDTLNADSPEEMHYNSDFERLTLGLKSAHPDHPDTDQIRYTFQPRVHLDDPVLQVGVHVLDEEMHEVIAGLRDAIPETFEYYEGHKYSAIKAEWSESVANPHDLDGEAFAEALDDETFNEAKQALVTLIETLHPEFVSAETP
ncbi:McrB family protein [Halorientalis brevis]|uniref:McrB family protein n=1 Tax=Halorientalis brevis TaxID=1126241 RepID=A0ABD6CJ53_9EURY